MSDVESFGHPEFDLLFVQLEVSFTGSLQSISEIFVMTFVADSVSSPFPTTTRSSANTAIHFKISNVSLVLL